jgi:hypothetical protein
MDEMLDPIIICIYCGDVMEAPNEKQIEVFGKPTCCDFDMLKIEREKMHTIMRSLDTLKKNIEEEVLKGMM